MGASSLARGYARIHQAHYPGGVYLLDKSAPVLEQLVEIGYLALRLDMSSSRSRWDRARLVLHELASRSCLLVCDDLHRPIPLSWLPSGHRCKLLVAATEPWPEPFHTIDVGPWGESQTRALWVAAGLPANVVSIVHQRARGVAAEVTAQIERWIGVRRELAARPPHSLRALHMACQRVWNSDELRAALREDVDARDADEAVALCEELGLLGAHSDLVAVQVLARHPALVGFVA